MIIRNQILNYIFSLEIRLGNSSVHQDNPLCGWLRGKELSDIKEKGDQNYKLISCSDESHVVGRYVSFISNDLDTPLTLCQGKVSSIAFLFIHAF